MATVLRARDVRHDRTVAIKVLHPELSEALGPERFQREVRIAARLTHPHILPLLDSGAVDGLLYYVMPFVDGETLRERLQREGELPLDDAVRLTREVAEALGYAHSLGIVHRDIKPENILLQRGHALVADFAHFAFSGGPTLTYHGRPEEDRWIMHLQPTPFLPANNRLRTLLSAVPAGLRFEEESSVDGGPWEITEDYRRRRIR